MNKNKQTPTNNALRDTPLTLDFMLQLNETKDGGENYELYIPHLGGKRVALDYVRRYANTTRSGCVIGLSNGKEVVEVGSQKDLLPDALIRQLEGGAGMLLIEVSNEEAPQASRYHLLSMEG